MANEPICLNQAQKQSAITFLSLRASRNIFIYPSSVISICARVGIAGNEAADALASQAHHDHDEGSEQICFLTLSPGGALK